MAISIGNIVDALITLGGSAHYREITDEVIRNGNPPFPADPQASVRARLQENCSDYEAYKGKQDLFQSDFGSGIWALRTIANVKSAHSLATQDQFREDLEAYEAREGSQVLREHLVRERDPNLVKKFKATLKEPRCEACSLLLSEMYGDLAKNYIEAHHRKPLATASGLPTRLEDLAALCPNCHRIIHKNYPMSVEELAELLAQPDGFSEQLIAVRNTRTTWKNAVREAVARLVRRTGNRRFSRHSLINEELDQIIADVQSAGATPQQTLSRILQELRDEDEIIFLDENRGEYLLNN
jgi:putative restriction endonuclease